MVKVKVSTVLTGTLESIIGRMWDPESEFVLTTLYERGFLYTKHKYEKFRYERKTGSLYDARNNLMLQNLKLGRSAVKKLGLE
jgi:hypothetical protein